MTAGATTARTSAQHRSAPAAVRPRRAVLAMAAAVAGVLGLAVLSLFVGVAAVSPRDLVGPDAGEAWRLLAVSRLPRTLAAVLAGMAMGVAGLIMQMLARNRFVEPSTAGTVEFAGLGLLVATLAVPGAPVVAKMVVATAFALAGTALFLRILRSIPVTTALVVPLVGLMLAAVVGAASAFIAYRYDLLQSLVAWLTGDLSGVLRGRYEMLWVVAAVTVVAYLAADRFTVAGLGEDVTTSLGLSYRRVRALGLTIVAVVTAVVVVVVGAIPFLGLVVPNLASMLVGDNLRRTLPWVAVLGAGLVLACDLVGRVVRHPYEIPVGTVVGVLGSAAFLYLILRRPAGVS